MWFQFSPRSSNYEDSDDAIAVDDDDDHDSDDDYEQYWQDSAVPVETEVCKYFTQEKGCFRGATCPNKHLAENGECLRCRQVLRLSDFELHCSELCEKTRQPPSNGSSVTRGVSRSAAHPLTTDVGMRRSSAPSTGEGNRLTSTHDSSSAARVLVPGRAHSSSSTASFTPSSPRPRVQPPKPLPVGTASSSTAIKSSPTSIPKTLWKKENVCRFHLKGSCFFGDRCKFLHLVDNQCILCEAFVTLDTLDQHLMTCPERQVLKAEMQKTEKVDCPICFNRLRDVPAPTRPSTRSRPWASRGDRFALLPDCGHLFCLTCITRWRHDSPRQLDDDYLLEDHQEGRYACPMCRKETRFIIPCNRVVEGPERCRIEQERFIHFLRPCHYFKQGKCRHGARCAFGHLGVDGLPVAPEQHRIDSNAISTAMFNDLFTESVFGSRLGRIISLHNQLSLDGDDDDDDDDDDDVSLSELLNPTTATFLLPARGRGVPSRRRRGRNVGTAWRVGEASTPSEQPSNRHSRQPRGNLPNSNRGQQTERRTVRADRASSSSSGGVQSQESFDALRRRYVTRNMWRAVLAAQATLRDDAVPSHVAGPR